MNLEWLVVGGGIHGVHIAARLLGEAAVAPGNLRILDPADCLLARWRHCTATTGMKHLRSPSVHHLDLNPWALQHFAGKRKSRKPGLFAYPYDRPALELFNDHCSKVIDTFGLADLHIQGQAKHCSVDCDFVSVETADGETLNAQNLVLAIGAGDQPVWPQWAPKNDPRIRHIFADDFDGFDESRLQIAVIGGGISAGQMALRLVCEDQRVLMISPHPLSEHQFDSDSGWLGPKNMARFERERCFDRRRNMISAARHKGSVPPDVRRGLRRAISRGEIAFVEDMIVAVSDVGGRLRLDLENGENLEVDHVVLATGFAAHRPGGKMLDDLIESASLPCASCGYPVVDTDLRWHPRIHVTGPLAELELGPASRNIAGARRAGDRLVQVACAHRINAA